MRSWVWIPWPHKNTEDRTWLAVTQCSYRDGRQRQETCWKIKSQLVWYTLRRKSRWKAGTDTGLPSDLHTCCGNVTPPSQMCKCAKQSYPWNKKKKSKSPKPKWIMAINYKTRIEFPAILQIALNIFLSFCLFILYKVAFSIDNYKTKVSINSV